MGEEKLAAPSNVVAAAVMCAHRSGDREMLIPVGADVEDTAKSSPSSPNAYQAEEMKCGTRHYQTVLQVLVSIQGLVLNANPYFNEPGYEKQFRSAKGEKESLAYTKKSFLLSCKSMLYILCRPPKHFEMFVKEHFQKRGHCILRAYDAYVKGAQVGSLSEDCTLPSNVAVESEKKSTSNVAAESENKSTSSSGFKLMLLKIVPKLISAFSEIGVDCKAF